MAVHLLCELRARLSQATANAHMSRAAVSEAALPPPPSIIAILTSAVKPSAWSTMEI